MKQALLILLSVFLLSDGCQYNGNYQKDDFLAFLAKEIHALGGKFNVQTTFPRLAGSWTIKRDKFGAAIDTKGISFESITNAFTATYGPPMYSTGANARHGPIYLYRPSVAGIAVFVSSRKEVGSEITLMKPIK